MRCTNSVWLDNRKIRVACGKCHACRIQRVSNWVMRIEHQAYTMGHKGIFVTLTFNDESLEKLGKLDETRKIISIYKQDLQLFFKRLRRSLEKEQKIKYFACGEYGEKFGRPHYHGIILGLDSSDLIDRQRIRDAWPYGNAYFGSVTPDSIRYVCAYIQKAYSGKKIDKEKYYGDKNPPFQLQSIGMGKDYFMIIENEIVKTGKIKYHGKELNPPKYYYDKCKEKIDNKLKNKIKLENQIKYKKKYPETTKMLNQYHNGISSAVQHDIVVERSKQRAKNIAKILEIKKLKKLQNNL